jgi:LacI family transcriptional regulator
MNGLAVSPARREQVLAAARALGYVPNQAARSMRGLPTMTIGVLMNLDMHPGTEVLTVINSLIRSMESHGYTCMVSFPDDTGNVELLLRRFAELRVDGLFYWNAIRADPLTLFRDAGVPVLAVVARDKTLDDIPLLSVDSGPIYRAVFRRLQDLGHSRVCEVDSARLPMTRVHRAHAIAQGLDWRPITVGKDPGAVARLVGTLCETPDAPTAVFAPYPVALQILAVCEELGVEVPRDLSLVSTTDSAGAALLRTPLATIRTDFELRGRIAARAMLDAIAGLPASDVVTVDAVDWIERASIGPAPRRA